VEIEELKDKVLTEPKQVTPETEEDNSSD